MRTLAIAAVAGSALLAGIATAHAADMAVKAPPMAPPPTFSWTGFYIGANIGGGWTPNNGSSDFGPLFPPFAVLPPLAPVFTVFPGQLDTLGGSGTRGGVIGAARSDITGRSSNSSSVRKRMWLEPT